MIVVEEARLLGHRPGDPSGDPHPGAKKKGGGEIPPVVYEIVIAS